MRARWQGRPDAGARLSRWMRDVAGGEDRAEAALELLALAATGGPDDGLRARVDALGRRLWAMPAGEEALLVRAALAAAASRWPALNLQSSLDARAGRALEALLGPDGAPLVPAGRALRALGAVALARSLCLSPTPPELDRPLLAGVDALHHLCGDAGLDAELDADAPGVTPVPGWDLRALRAAAAGWGLGPAEALPPARGWALYAFRGTGLAALHGRAGARPQRVLFDARDDRTRWDLDGEPVLWLSGGATEGALAVARVDGRKVRLASTREGPTRELRVEGARVQLRDTGRASLRLQIAPTWALRDEGEQILGSRGGASLQVRLDPRWRWTRDGGRISGHGAPDELSCSFEIRG